MGEIFLERAHEQVHKLNSHGRINNQYKMKTSALLHGLGFFLKNEMSKTASGYGSLSLARLALNVEYKRSDP